MLDNRLASETRPRQHIANAGTRPKSIRKKVTSFAGYCSATVFANASTTAKQNIEASMLTTLLSGSALLAVALDDGIAVRKYERVGIISCA